MEKRALHQKLCYPSRSASEGGLEIQCEVVLTSRATMLQSRLTARYMELVTDLYIEPAEDRAVGNLLNFVMTLPPVVNTPLVSTQNRKKKKSHDKYRRK